MPAITESHVTDSIAEALQFVACYHPPDFIAALSRAHAAEESPAAREAIAQILVNSRMCALGQRPICQDTGVANVFVDIGVQARLDWHRPLQDIVDDAVRRAYRLDSNPLRASVVRDPFDSRQNTGDNTPAMIQTRMVAGDRVEITVSLRCWRLRPPWQTGWWSRCAAWARAGARRGCWVLASAAASTRPWPWPRRR